jgi:hypothetical protein
MFFLLLGACPTLTVLLRRMICDQLHRSRPEKILNVVQRIHLRFFLACGLAPGRTSFASSRRQCRTGSWTAHDQNMPTRRTQWDQQGALYEKEAKFERISQHAQ